MIKYDRRKVTDILLDEYHKKYGNGNPEKTMSKLLDCMDDAFIDEYTRQISGIEDSIKRKAIDVQDQANKTLNELQATIERNGQSTKEAEKANEIKDERVVDALKAYQMIINMDFDTPQQKLQNIQNASYFIWALYAKESATASMFLKSVTDVKKEDDSRKDSDDPWNNMRRI